MSVGATLLAVGVSLGAIAALSVTDAKRRRAFRLPPVERRWGRLLWGLVFVPGILVPFTSGAAGFVIWTGAVTVAGWVVAALPPGRVTDWGVGPLRPCRGNAWAPQLPPGRGRGSPG